MTDKTPDFIEDEPGGETPLFTAKELAEIKAKAKAEILADKKENFKKKLLADEKNRLRREEGLTTGNTHADEIVNIHIDLPSYAANILVNGAAYWHGRLYPVPRHVAASLQETMFNAWKHQSEIKGESWKEFYAKQHVDNLYKPGAVTSRHTFSARGM